MKPNRSLLAVLGVLSALVLSVVAVRGQAPEAPASAKTWIGRAGEIEEYLKTAEVVKMEAIPVGVTKPSRAYLAPGGLCESMSWKPIKPARYRGFWESYLSEIAAYELDKLLDMQMVPPTVEKRVDSNLGAAIMWVKPVKSFKDLGSVPTPPPAYMEAWNRQMIRAKMFDNLINNKDPNMGNWLVDPAWNLIVIDHTRAFVSGKEMIHKMTRIDREFWGRMKALSADSLSAAMGKWLEKGQIKNLLERRDLMQVDIDKMVAEKGEGATFIP